MDIALFSTDGFMFLLRWLHYFFGIIWIGILYYFNFIQGSFFSEIEASVKSVATQKLVPRALWWFRWGAMGTFLTGLAYLSIRAQQIGPIFYEIPWGVSILLGALLGTLMWFNVWFVIWPAQKVVIQSATQVAQGGQAIPEAASRGARATCASRTNTLFSIPLLFYMGGASHLAIGVDETSNFNLLWMVLFVIVGAIEFNALKGKPGPMASVRGVITSGFLLTAVFYACMEFFL